MSTIDFSPQPGSAPRAAVVRAQAWVEAKLLVRNGEQLLLALVIPMAALVLGRTAARGWGFEFSQTAPSVLALAILSTGFTSTAIATGFERRYGVLERLATTPLGRAGLVLGKSAAVLLVIAGQLVILGGVALALGWRPTGSALSWLQVVVVSAASIVTFVGFALAMAGSLRAEMTLALANVIHLVVAGAGGILVSLSLHPGVWGSVLAFLPSGALGEAWRATSGEASAQWSIPVSLVWAVVAVLVARKVFRWTS